ncbi:hypothetical protein MTBSS4_670010 [Magnetospirillum sp. SS-4]|nr:hypothetical protein MTBSS4_670010 [Magnetospirillum sp. SS-4]
MVNRDAQAGHARRRRMDALSSVGRESFTWVSSCPQKGQRMLASPSPQSMFMQIIQETVAASKNSGTAIPKRRRLCHKF